MQVQRCTNGIQVKDFIKFVGNYDSQLTHKLYCSSTLQLYLIAILQLYLIAILQLYLIALPYSSTLQLYLIAIATYSLANQEGSPTLFSEMAEVQKISLQEVILLLNWFPLHKVHSYFNNENHETQLRWDEFYFILGQYFSRLFFTI